MGRPVQYYPENVLSISVMSCLSGRVESPVVDRVVVALGEELDAPVLLLVQLQHAVHDRDVAALHLPNLEWVLCSLVNLTLFVQIVIHGLHFEGYKYTEDCFVHVYLAKKIGSINFVNC